MRDLVLDHNIKTWVFVPIVLITLLLGVLKHYLSICLEETRTTRLQQIQMNHLLSRIRMLKLHGASIPKTAFLSRVQHYVNLLSNNYNNNNNRQKSASSPSSPTWSSKYPSGGNFDPSFYASMLKNNAINVVPMFLTGSWIVYMFSDFVATRLPFSLSVRFKNMLQRSISLRELNEPWVSSASWYCLCVVGLRDIYALMLGDYTDLADICASFKENLLVPGPSGDHLMDKELEELQMVDHDWILSELEG